METWLMRISFCVLFAVASGFADTLPDLGKPDYETRTEPTPLRAGNLCSEIMGDSGTAKIDASTGITATLLVGWETQGGIADLDSGGGPVQGIGGFFDILFGKDYNRGAECETKPLPHGIRLGFAKGDKLLNGEGSIDAFATYLFRPNAMRYWAGPGVTIQGHKSKTWGIGPQATVGIGVYEWVGLSVYGGYFIGGRSPYKEGFTIRADLFIATKFKQEHFGNIKW